VQFATQAVQSGQQDLVIAGGIQKMSQYPILSGVLAGEPYGETSIRDSSPGWLERYGKVEVTQFAGAEAMAAKWNITRADAEDFAYESHRRALAAMDSGYFKNEIASYFGVETDEGPRRGTSRE